MVLARDVTAGTQRHDFASFQPQEFIRDPVGVQFLLFDQVHDLPLGNAQDRELSRTEMNCVVVMILKILFHQEILPEDAQ